MFILIAIVSFFLFTLSFPTIHFPATWHYMSLGIVFQQEYGFKRMGLGADESGRSISARVHRHGIQTKPWLRFYPNTEDALKFVREIRNGCLWHTVSLFIWPRHSFQVLLTFTLFFMSLSTFRVSESQKVALIR